MTAIENRRILVVGMGRSGMACARFLSDRGGQVTVADSAASPAVASAAAALQDRGVAVVLGPHPEELFERADMIVLSPGVPHTIPPLAAAARRGIPVMGEIELASRFVEDPVVAVTGTNGKTTTTTLVGQMLKASGLSVFVGGNIGTPLIEHVSSGRRKDRVVVEVSSFQLDTITRFRPRVGVLLNVTPDHMDRYDDFDAYTRSKGRIFENQSASDVAVLNGNDPAVAGISRRIAARRWFFNPTSSGEEGAHDEGDGLVFRIQGREDRRLDLSAVHLVGWHNRENIAAAALATLAAGGSMAGIESALKGFRGLPHRMSPVATVGGVRYVDDSKATNTDAVRRALESFDCPVVLIMGGRDKGGGYDALRAMVRERVKHLVVIGEAREAIARKLGECCGGQVSMAASMDAAVQRACQAAAAGDVVLLSPACASFDMFTSYAHRGEAFQRAVARLTKEV